MGEEAICTVQNSNCFKIRSEGKVDEFIWLHFFCHVARCFSRPLLRSTRRFCPGPEKQSDVRGRHCPSPPKFLTPNPLSPLHPPALRLRPKNWPSVCLSGGTSYARSKPRSHAVYIHLPPLLSGRAELLHAVPAQESSGRRSPAGGFRCHAAGRVCRTPKPPACCVGGSRRATAGDAAVTL
jgi:hypothetical protein